MPDRPDPTDDQVRARPRLRPVACLVVAAALAATAAWAGDSAARRPDQGVRSAAVPLGHAADPEGTAGAAHARVPAGAGTPRRLRIPALGVDAAVVPVRAPGRTLLPPTDPMRIGWWADGARPGARTGSALLAGHTVRRGRGALDRLEHLRPGDRVVVHTGRDRIRYVVQRVQVFSKGRLAAHAPRVFSQSVPGRLVLVTCEDWDGSGYRSNVVVTAQPAE